MKKLYVLLTVLTVFQISFSQPANDTCAASENIAVAITSNSYTFDINSAVINNEVGCTGTTADYADVWFDFTMPVNGNLYVDAGIAWNVLALYDACSGNQIRCGAANELFTDLVSGTIYKLRIFRSSNTAPNTGFQSFSIIAFEQVTNDTCATATTITVSETATNQSFDIGGADINNEVGCEGTTAQDFGDIWYKFTMPVDGKLDIDGDIVWNNFALYEASCTATQIDCGANSILFENLTLGTEYFLRVFRTRANMDNSTFRSFSTRVFQQPNNDSCANSSTLTISETEIDVDFEIGGADVNNEVGCSGTVAENLVDIWYDFEMPFNGNVAIDSDILWNRFALYDACAGTELGCDATDAFFTNLTENTTYKLRVFRTEGFSTNTSFTSFKIRAFPTVNNDICADAINITVSASDNDIAFDIGGALLNTEVGCDGTTAEEYVDVWYKFTMPQNGNISVTSPINWNNFALYNGCSGSEIGCANANAVFTSLTASTEYWLRVFRTKVFADDDFRDFTIKTENTLNNDSFSLQNSISIHPNPVSSQIQIQLENNNTLLKAQLYDILGKEVFRTSKTHANFSSIKNGIYLLRITTTNGIITKKVVVRH